MEWNHHKVFRLKGKIQHYAWGGERFIPGLLGISNEQGIPYAEYWMGAHQNASSEIIMEDGKKVKLNEYIHAFPDKTLGPSMNQKFGRLPFLLKVLDVKDMLSIQVHPDKKNAEFEFANEEKSRIPLEAPHRNYKDDNHKPELMVALSEFWLLHGFKVKSSLEKILSKVTCLQFLLPVFEEGGYALLYKTVMEMDQAVVNEILQPLLFTIIPQYQNNQLSKDEEEYWVARAALTYNQPGKIDRGIFSIYFFNLLHMHPGDAIFQDAGLPHAYLEGQNMEIMANSDNVLRGGLTPKHIDVKELLKHIRFQETIPHIIHEKKGPGKESVFDTPAPDFELGKMTLLSGEESFEHTQSVRVYILMEGSLQVFEKEGNHFIIQKGESWVAFHQASFQVKALKDSLIFVAGMPGSGS